MSQPPKDIYAHRLETLDEMRRLMIAEGPLRGGTVGLTLPGAGSLPVRSVTTSLVPQVVHPPQMEMPESANRVFWWILVSGVAIAGLVASLWQIAPQLPPAAPAGAARPLQPAAPKATEPPNQAAGPSPQRAVEAPAGAAAPSTSSTGWSDKAAYDAWNPKFDVSLSAE